MKKLYTYKKENITENDVVENPMELLNKVDMLEEVDGILQEREFYEVEKTTSKKFKLGFGFKLKGLVDAHFEYVKESVDKESNNNRVQCASGYASQLSASGDDSQLSASGNYSKLSASGNYSKLSASGYASQLSASGDASKLSASGNYSKLSASGNYSKLSASGDDSKLSASGNYSKLSASGDASVVANIGIKGLAMASNGSWITLAEYDESDKIKMVKSAQIGNDNYLDYNGKQLKPMTYYQLVNNEFTPIILADGDRMVILSTKESNGYIVYKTQYLYDFIENNDIKQYVVCKGNYMAHGGTIKQAISDVEFKFMQNMDLSEHAKRIKEQGYFTPYDYRLITGACQYGTNRWLEENGFNWNDNKPINEVLELVKGQYGYDRFKEFYEQYFKEEQ